MAMLDPGVGKTRRACVCGYARDSLDTSPGVVYDFGLGHSAQYPIVFFSVADDDPHKMRGWCGTLVRDKH